MFFEKRLRRARHQAELDVTQVGNDIADHEEPVVLHVDLQVVAEIGALGKQNEVRQTERAGDNLIGVLLVNRHLRRTVAHRHRLRCKWTLATEGQGVAGVQDVDRLGREEGHITADLLEVE